VDRILYAHYTEKSRVLYEHTLQKVLY